MKLEFVERHDGRTMSDRGRSQQRRLPARMMVAETERLLIRHVGHDDIDAFAELFGDPEVMRFSSGTKSRDETLRWIEGCLLDYQPERWGYGLWAVVFKGTGQVIGFCGLTRYDDLDGQQEVEIGYRFARRSWGQGFATEAASATRDYAFSRLRMNRLFSLIEAENAASIQVARKIGMSLEKTITLWDKPIGVYVMTRPEQA